MAAQLAARRAAEVDGLMLLSAWTDLPSLAGEHFPGWLVSTVIGVVASYAIVASLGRHPGTRALADSGLFFLSLLVGIALAAWWVLFSGF